MTFADGRILSTLVLERSAQQLPGVLRFQFRQRPDDSFDMLIVKASWATDALDTALLGVEAIVEAEAGFFVKIRPRFVDEIELTPAGKHKYVIPLSAGAPSGMRDLA